MEELQLIEKVNNKYELSNFDLIKKQLEDYCRDFQEIKDKETLKIAKGIKADFTKKIKLLKDTLKAYKNDYFERLDMQMKELSSLLEKAENKQKEEIDAFVSLKAQEKYNDLAILFNNLQLDYSLDAVLKALDIDLKLEKWTIENAKEAILKSKYEETHTFVFRCNSDKAKEIENLLAQIEEKGISITETIDLIKGE